MTQVIPSPNHPLRNQAEFQKRYENKIYDNKKSVNRQNKPQQQADLAALVLQFEKQGGEIEVLQGFPEVIKSNAAFAYSRLAG